MKLLMEETGQGMAEYGLILVFIAMVVITTALVLGETIRNSFSVVEGLF